MRKFLTASIAIAIGILLNPMLLFTAVFIAYLILKPITSHRRLIEGAA
jgi:hypothetical protein